MTQYIPKNALVAEIKKRKAINEKSYMQAFLNSSDNRDSFGYKVQEDIDILSSIDTIEVKEVDLEKEWKKFLKDGDVGFKEIAKHFFELGLKAQKGEEA